ncbi:HAD-like domain-containing protein [Naematelia encephala]|uniref:HAD-like domain-containing protein n=1 Tax=Naematelia encephala TaxID=71784 RepID=A0A1Y2AUK6_9TREE|nr:HAD-like domain-containing protein [Naematelia encephala]
MTVTVTATVSKPASYTNKATFVADGVLFDMDGTLTDSIAAVEAAWTAKADELGLEPEVVIAATHGRRASDNLMELVPGLRKEHVEREVEKFEKTILDFADTPPQSRKGSFSSSRKSSFAAGTRALSGSTLGSLSPMTPIGGTPDQRSSGAYRPDIALAFTSFKLGNSEVDVVTADDTPFEDEDEEEEKLLDMSVRILPGVRELIDSLPEGKYAVATSGAKTYCHGCLTRTGITIPKVCVTADDKRLLRGKPHPDPFLLAAKDLGIDPTRAVIFEDSPSGIKAAVAAGSTVIAVCTSHKREQIDKLGAHYVVDTMDQVKVEHLPSGELAFTVEH